MATPAQDLNNKLKLEAQLRPKIRKYNKKIIEAFSKQYRSDGNVINVSQFDDELNTILTEHYQDTSNIFSDNIGPDLPADIQPTDDERRDIEAALATYFFLQSKKKSIDINSTTQNELSQSVVEASQDELSQGLIGREFVITVATLASVFADRKINARVETIVQTETQFAAETAKGTEAEILSGRNPSIIADSPRQTEVKKRWDTVGDSNVRDAHVAADSQTQNISDPFIVDFEQLRWPGDTSLGASLGNIINCRCSVDYNQSDIIDSRRS